MDGAFNDLIFIQPRRPWPTNSSSSFIQATLQSIPIDRKEQSSTEAYCLTIPLYDQGQVHQKPQVNNSQQDNEVINFLLNSSNTSREHSGTA